MPEYNGTAGPNSISGTEDADVINGLAGNDSLRGFGGNDELHGDEDNDYLIGGAGDDTLDGGAGLDRIGYYHTDPALGGVTISLLNQGIAQNTVIAGWDTLIGIENVSGTPFADTLIGDNNDNWLWGSAATISAGNVSTTNNDYIDGGAGNDTIVVGIGNHTLIGGADTDTLRFTENGSNEPGITITLAQQSGQVQNTGAGNWTITGFENLSGGTGNDNLTGNGQTNVLAGSSGDDRLSGGGGDDFLYGDGSYQLDITAGGGSGAIVLYADIGEAFGGATGNDSLFGDGGNDTLYGGGGNDGLTGATGNDTLYGGSGHDFLSGGLDNDYIDGGSGFDRVSFASINAALGGVTVSLAVQGAQNVGAGLGLDTLVNVEAVSGTPFADNLTGDDNDNWLWGSASIIQGVITSNTNDDTISGGGGNDLLQVGIGNHSLNGGADNDTLSFTEGVNFLNLTVDLNLQGGAQNTGQGIWTINDVENVSSSTGNDVLIGNQYANVLAGELGDDELYGGGGNDTLYGDGRIWADSRPTGGSGPITTTMDATPLWVGGVAGNDYLEGGDGNDTIYGAGGDDEAWGGDGADTIYGGDGNDSLFGGSIINSAPQPLDEADTIYGEAGNDVIRGGGGDDYLDGGIGDDNLRGDLGNDTLIGGEGRDFVSYRFDDSAVTSGVYFDAQNFAATASFTMSDGRGGTDTLSDVEALGVTGSDYDDVIIGSQFVTSTATNAGNQLNGQGGNDTIYGGGDWDIINGGNGNDLLFGFGGADVITGGAGNDQLLGGTGNDFLDGGADNDHFVGDLGDDTIAGGAGHDSVGFNFNVAAVTSGVVFDGTDFASTTNFTWSDGRGGTDSISNVEALIVSGSAYDDILVGSFSTWSTDTRVANQLFGNDGNDIISGGDQWDQLDGGNGNDFIEGYGGGDGISGGAGNDRLIGGDGNDYIDGGADADYITGGFGDDIIVGGAGVDRIGYYQTNAALGGVTVSLAVAGSQNTGSQGWDTVSGVENVSGTPFADTITGDDNSNWLWGSAAFISAGNVSSTNNDTIDGGGGNDLLQVGIGNHTLIGGANTDTVRFTENGSPESDLTVSLAIAGAQATGNGTWTLSGIENLSGGIANDSLTGDGQANVLAGDAGNDRLFGGGGNDTLYGDGVIVFDGAAGAIATTADIGVNGNDELEGGLGNDLLNGGGGTDTASYANAGGAVNVNLATGVASGADGNDTLVNIENLIGGAFDDTLVGGTGDNVIAGGAGVDTIVGLGGNDVLDGGAGSDNLYGMQGNDTLLGGADNDNLRGGTGDDLIDGGAGFNLAGYSPVLSDTIGSGVTVDLRIQGIAQNTGQGLDTLVNIQGLAGTNFADTLTGNAQTNVLIAAGSLAGSSGGDDQLFGMEGDDLLIVGSGTLLLNGGLNSDTVSFNAAGGALLNGVNVTLMTQGSAQNTGSGNMTLVDIENLSGTGFADIFTGDGNANTLSGAGGDDQLFGGAGNDILHGDGVYTAFTVAGSLQAPVLVLDASVYAGQVVGNDTLDGGDGDDQLFGGGGTDTATYASATGGVNVNLATGVATGAAGTDSLSSIENATGSGFDDILTGDGGANTLSGLAGRDRLIGGAGDDTLQGGDGADYITGGAGNDTIAGGDGRDRAGYYHTNAADGGVTVSLATLTAQNVGGGQGSDTISGIEALSGTPFADTLTGDGSNNWLWGAAAYIGAGNVSATNNDRLDGGGGNDLLTVGIGTHTLIGGTGIDTLQFTENDGPEPNLTITLLSQGRAQATGAGSWTLTGIENLSGGSGTDKLTGDDLDNVLAGGLGVDTLNGGGGRDVLIGDGFITADSNFVTTTTYDQVGGGNDIMVGGRGDDYFYGGRGNDTMTGGADNDWFVLQANSGNDTVTDFGRTDMIAFDFAGAPASYAALTIVSSRGGTLISWGTTDSIFLEGVRPSAVTAANFFFGAPALPSASAAESLSSKVVGDMPALDASLRFDHFTQLQHEFMPHRTDDLLGL